MTTLLDEQTLALHSEGVRHIPCLFQEYIPKAVELRVTIIGDEIFVAEIDSQSQAETAIDWRDYSVPMRMKRGSLPDDIVSKCFALVRGFGLNFSALDFIVTPEGEYVFLESNPNGQFLFVEQWVPELKMVDALLGCLMHG
jgi:glutathione synthase/RimK-type ligase-like ATP-grasp enzyme